MYLFELKMILDMKVVKFSSVVIGLLCMISCAGVDEIKFKEPIPSNYRNRSQFGFGIQGEYLSQEDSTILVVSKNQVIQKWIVEKVVAKVEVDSLEGYKWQNGKLVANDASLVYSYEIVGDSIEINATPQYQRFVIEDRTALRKMGNIYFMNEQRADNLWEVQVLVKESRNKVRLKSLYATEENMALMDSVATIEKVMDENDEVEDLIAQPTNKELKALLETEILSGGTVFTRKE